MERTAATAGMAYRCRHNSWLASTLVLPRQLDPIRVLDAADTHRTTALAVLPETLRGIVGLTEATSGCYDLSALSVIAVQGPALASDLAIPAMSRFGDILYHLHGSSVVRLGDDWQRLPTAAEPPRPLALLG
jgi:hypothetical protein